MSETFKHYGMGLWFVVFNIVLWYLFLNYKMSCAYGL